MYILSEDLWLHAGSYKLLKVPHENILVLILSKLHGYGGKISFYTLVGNKCESPPYPHQTPTDGHPYPNQPPSPWRQVTVH